MLNIFTPQRSPSNHQLDVKVLEFGDGWEEPADWDLGLDTRPCSESDVDSSMMDTDSHDSVHIHQQSSRCSSTIPPLPLEPSTDAVPQASRGSPAVEKPTPSRYA